jgi:hypothetical protein
MKNSKKAIFLVPFISLFLFFNGCATHKARVDTSLPMDEQSLFVNPSGHYNVHSFDDDDVSWRYGLGRLSVAVPSGSHYLGVTYRYEVGNNYYYNIPVGGRFEFKPGHTYKLQVWVSDTHIENEYNTVSEKIKLSGSNREQYVIMRLITRKEANPKNVYISPEVSMGSSGGMNIHGFGPGFAFQAGIVADGKITTAYNFNMAVDAGFRSVESGGIAAHTSLMGELYIPKTNFGFGIGGGIISPNFFQDWAPYARASIIPFRDLKRFPGKLDIHADYYFKDLSFKLYDGSFKEFEDIINDFGIGITLWM